MSINEISNIRLGSQHISTTKMKSVKELVGWMCAMQAQDYAMAKWAVGTRIPGVTTELVEKAIDHAEIIRTHVLRPTWHLVSADDIYWLLELSAPQIKANLKTRDHELGLTETVLNKSYSAFTEALSEGNHLNREELISILEKAKIPTNDNRAYHIFLRAELEGILCSGAVRNNKLTYALLSERVPKPKNISREDALQKLAGKYFSSHGPATLQDFTWWSGLSARDARNALEMVKADFNQEKTALETYWFDKSFSLTENEDQQAYLLPAFDEFIISYKDRKASLSLPDHKKAVSQNGIFRPVMVIDGQVKGIWKRTFKKEKVIIETAFFQPPDQSAKKLVEKAAGTFGNFLGKKPDLKHTLN